jgi:ATP:ADP antiporter, AAA family
MLRPFSRLVDVRPGEGRALLLAAACFLLLLFANGVLRSLRDGLPEVGDMPWLFTGTFFTTLAAVPAYLWLVARFPRRRIVTVAYVALAGSLLLFAGAHRAGADGRAFAAAFWVWFSTINVLLVALFWSLAADVFGQGRGRRVFAVVAMGGTLGALLGATFTAGLSVRLGAEGLLLLAAGLLVACRFLVAALFASTAGWPARAAGDDRAAAIGGALLDGARHVARRPYLRGVAAQVLCLTAVATFTYMLKAHVVRADAGSALERVAGFARVDAVACALELGLQLFLTAPLLRRGGLVWGLRSLPAVALAGCALLAALPTLAVLGLVEGVRRAVQYAVYRPARELLFTVVPPVETYGAKGCIDTFVYRSGDVLAVWAADGLVVAGAGAVGLALAGVPVAAAWYALAGWLAREHDAQAALPVKDLTPDPLLTEGQPA